MPWASRLLRGDRVWVRALDSGVLAGDGEGRVDIVYKPGGKVYRASVRNLETDPEPQTLLELPLGGAATTATKTSPAKTKSGRKGLPAAGPAPADAIIVYADGACSGNPGPCGIGVVILDGASRRELSEYLGIGTNNVAELTAIIRALEESPRDRCVMVHSDSSYALGLLGQGWKAKANQDLVARMREVATEFDDLRLVKVAGHAGIVENERADVLAREAVVRRK